jgi:hypothetical protein
LGRSVAYAAKTVRWYSGRYVNRAESGGRPAAAKTALSDRRQGFGELVVDPVHLPFEVAEVGVEVDVLGQALVVGEHEPALAGGQQLAVVGGKAAGPVAVVLLPEAQPELVTVVGGDGGDPAADAQAADRLVQPEVGAGCLDRGVDAGRAGDLADRRGDIEALGGEDRVTPRACAAWTRNGNRSTPMTFAPAWRACWIASRPTVPRPMTTTLSSTCRRASWTPPSATRARMWNTACSGSASAGRCPVACGASAAIRSPICTPVTPGPTSLTRAIDS